MDHRLVEPPGRGLRADYAHWTRQNKRNRPGRYRFRPRAGLGHAVARRRRYVVDVAADVSGNRTVARFPIRIANSAKRV